MPERANRVLNGFYNANPFCSALAESWWPELTNWPWVLIDCCLRSLCAAENQHQWKARAARACHGLHSKVTSGTPIGIRRSDDNLPGHALSCAINAGNEANGSWRFLAHTIAQTAAEQAMSSGVNEVAQ